MALTKIIGEGVGSVDTITTDNLTVDTNTLYVDSANNNVGIQTSSPLRSLHVIDSSADPLVVERSTSGNVSIQVTDGTDTAYFGMPTGGGFAVDDDSNLLASPLLRVSTGGDLTPQGGIYLGGTGSANKLDDYEEGTWTPTVTGSTTAGTATYSAQEGKYTKIGNFVYAKAYIVWNSGTGVGNLQISGLPFTSSNDSGFHNTGTMFIQNVAWTGDYLSHFVKNNSTNILLYGIANNSTATQVSYDAAGDMQLMCVYRTS